MLQNIEIGVALWTLVWAFCYIYMIQNKENFLHKYYKRIIGLGGPIIWFVVFLEYFIITYRDKRNKERQKKEMERYNHYKNMGITEGSISKGGINLPPDPSLPPPPPPKGQGCLTTTINVKIDK